MGSALAFTEWVPSLAGVPVEDLPENIELPLVTSYLLASSEVGLTLSIFEYTEPLRGAYRDVRQQQ